MSTHHIAPAHEVSREQARSKTTGKFQNWQSSEAVGVEPLQAAASHDTRQDAVELFAGHYRTEHLAADVDEAFTRIQTPDGEKLAFEYFARQRYDEYAVWGTVKGDDFERFDELAELGWNGSAENLVKDGKNAFGTGFINRIADEGISPQRLAKLKEARLDSSSSVWATEAMLAADDAALDRIRDSWNPRDWTEHYRAVIEATGNPQKIARVNECLAAGIYDTERIEAIRLR